MDISTSPTLARVANWHDDVLTDLDPDYLAMLADAAAWTE